MGQNDLERLILVVSLAADFVRSDKVHQHMLMRKRHTELAGADLSRDRHDPGVQIAVRPAGTGDRRGGRHNSRAKELTARDRKSVV